MPNPNLSPSLPPNSSCPPSILVRGITPKSPSSSSSPNRNTSSPLLEFSPTLTTIPLHLWTNLPWVPSPISALLGTPIQLARYPAAAANVNTINTINTDRPSPSPSSPSSGAKTFPPCAKQNGEGVQQTEETEKEAEENGNGDFQTIPPLLPFFLEIDPEDMATFGKVRLNWLQGTVIVSSSSSSSSMPTYAASATTGSKDAADPVKQATEPPSSSCPRSPTQQQHLPLHPRLLAQITQYLNGPVFRAIKSYRTLDPQSAEKKMRAREIREEMFCPEAFGGWVLRGGSEDEGEGG